MKKFFILVLGALLLASLGIALALYNLNPLIARLKPTLEGMASRALHQSVTFDKLEGRLFPSPVLTGQGIKIGGESNAMTLDSIKAGIALTPLLKKELVITSLTLLAPKIQLNRTEEGFGEFSGAESEPTSAEPSQDAEGTEVRVSLEKIAVRDGTICINADAKSVALCATGVRLDGGLSLNGGQILGSGLQASGNLFGQQRVSLVLGQGSYDGNSKKAEVERLEVEYGPMSVTATGSYLLESEDLELSIATSEMPVVELQKLLPPGTKLPDFVLSSGTVSAQGTVKQFSRGPFEVETSLSLSALAGSMRGLPFTALNGLAKLGYREDLLSIETDKLTTQLGKDNEVLLVKGKVHGPPTRLAGKIEMSLSKFTTDTYAVLLELLPKAIRDAEIHARGDLSTDLELHEGRLTAFKGLIDLQDGRGRYLKYPLDNMHGRLAFAGHSTLERIESEAFTVSIGTEQQEVGLAGSWRVPGNTGKTKVMSHKLSLANIEPLLSKLGIDLKSFKPEAVFTGVGLHFTRTPQGTNLVEGQVTLNQGRVQAGEQLVTEINGQLFLATEDRQKAIRMTSDSLRYQIGAEKAACNLRSEFGIHGIRVHCSNNHIFGGDLDLAVVYEPGGRSKLQIKGSGKSLSVERLLKVTPSHYRQKIEGTLEGLSFDVTGEPGAHFSHTLQGGASLLLRDGTLREINVGRSVLDAIGKLPFVGGRFVDRISPRFQELFQSNDTEIQRLQGELRFRGDIIETPGLTLVSDHYRVAGRGKVGLNSQIDMDAIITFDEELTEALATSVRELGRVRNRDGTLSLPLSIRGVLPRVLVLPDLKQILELGARRVIEDKASELFQNLLGQGNRGRSTDERRPNLLDDLLRGGGR